MLRDKRIDLTVCIFEGSKDKTISFVRHFLSKVLGKLRVLTFWQSTCNPFNRFRNKRFTVPLYSFFLLLEALGQKIKNKTVGSILVKTVDNFTST